jgi:DNA helicase II / ATP-dependent DNA helicase PcrA
MPNLIADLNPDQQQAVMHDRGPLLILAGAGSGKTRALTHRAAYLITHKHIPPEHILLTTFTNKAAGEMQDRLESLVDFRLPFAGTFHSLSARLLRLHGHIIGLSPDYVIFDAADQLTVIKQATVDLRLDPKEVSPRSIQASIEAAKHQLIGSKEYADLSRGPFQQNVAKVYRRYQKLLRDYHALDFNDLLIYCINLLSVPEIKTRYQNQFVHVLVDEYQDTNKAQYQITKILSGKHRNLTVVGDASQAIYSWRGADYRNLNLLKEDFSDLTVIKLEQNYRSTQTILDAAGSVIAHNTLHPVLSLWTEIESGDKISLFQAGDEYDEARYIVNQLRARAGKNIDFSRFAVLYRTNAQSRVLEEVFVREGIPYVLVGGVKFYQRKEVKDVLSYIRFAFNQADQVSYARLVKLGKRRLVQFNNWLSTADLTAPPLTILDDILTSTKYLDRYDSDNPEDRARIENVQELRSVAQGFASVSEFLENIALVEQEEVVAKNQESRALTLMTLHASKGLEFDNVFIIGFEEGLFPHSRSLLSREDIEEERRLCYVGITRAKSKLFLTYAKSRLYFGNRSQNQTSRFLSEIPQDLLESHHQNPKVTSTRRSPPIDDQLLDSFLEGDIDIDTFLNS